MHHQRGHQADVAIRRHFDCHGSMSRYDMRCRWSAGVFSGGKLEDKAEELNREQEASLGLAKRNITNAANNMQKNIIF